MNLLPYDSETLVSSHPKEEVLYYLNRVTREVNYLDKRSQKKSDAVFNGIVGQNGFRISKVVDKSDTFLPLLLGKIEDTPRGSIIFIDYKLFPGALFFLIFWTVVLLAFTALYVFLIPNYTYAIICSGLGLSNYFLAIYFFNRQVKASRKVFHQLINFQMKD
ncbi:hypothetical protein PBT90_00795 [Algoriphagus halophytocola]|uniref:Uncharacterized protein n=1 Tax=Algoriphagus halophytocola TaxID=2991499 RepID=A0ABY6MDZ1_9BACT|nr:MULTISPECIES: hypothetical protein [unclassified Algoriphagus]UZD21995.1 hypothetical protein OM944_15120 [Algoriphagus sp. TR-M5]WBL43246.1 hypothetical protein PBT90_00795 [Algoriphagus sp. TR-M9]